MPELPEVQTTVNGLNATVKGLRITDIWTDLAKNTLARADYRESIKYLPFFKSFVQKTRGAKILSAERRAKNILLNLSNENTILIHMKMTGHILYGAYTQNKKEDRWSPSDNEKNDALRDPFNGHIHFVLSLSNGKHLVLSDVRKFAKVTILSTETAHDSKHLRELGPEIFEKSFTKNTWVQQLMKKPRGKIKSVLMDQSIISGVGNIYSDEALYLADIHPLSVVSSIPQQKLVELFLATKTVLKKGIDFGGDSTSDYRRIDGTRGEFSHEHNVYRRKGMACKKKNCRGVIIRSVIGGRSAHFCNTHQQLYK